MNNRLLEALIELKKHGPRIGAGICMHVWPEDVEEFQQLATHWPEYSGDPMYPVPTPPTHEDALSAMGAYGMLPKWSGKYGDARRRLLDWAIEELQQQ